MHLAAKCLIVMGLVGLEVGGLLLATGSLGTIQGNPSRPARSEAEVDAGQERERARQQVEDRNAASRMGISLDDYRRARNKEAYAHVGCHLELQRRIGREVPVDYSSGHGWRVSGDSIIVTGPLAGLRSLGGGGGGDKPTAYECIFDMRMGKVTRFVIR
jgi:hypothetical protein